MIPPPFTRHGLRAGATGVLPLLAGVAVYGGAFGVMAQARGLTLLEAALFSAWVYAGSAQMASLQVWDSPAPILAVFFTTLAMNARYLLLGAALRPWFRGLPAHKSYASLFLMGDGNWALAMRERDRGRNDAAFLLGSGLAMWFAWVGATVAGHAFGQLLGNPAQFGIDFILAAFFATMAVEFLRRRSSLMPFVAGVGVAIVVERFAPGPWYILAGAAAGSAAGAYLVRSA